MDQLRNILCERRIYTRSCLSHAHSFGQLLLPLQPASIEYVHNHYHEKISLEYLAALEHYNPSYYCQWFQKKTGLSPIAFIQKLRLDRTKYLLINTDFSLLRIAQEVGYEQQSSLSRLFRQKEGMSASDYRKIFQR